MNERITAIFADLAAAAISLEKRYPNNQEFGKEMRKKIHQVINNKKEGNGLEDIQTPSK